MKEDDSGVIPRHALLLPIEREETIVGYCNRSAPLVFKSLGKYAHMDGRISLLFPQAIEVNFSPILLLKPFDELLNKNTHYPLFKPYLTASPYTEVQRPDRAQCGQNLMGLGREGL